MGDHPRGTDHLLCSLKIIGRLRAHERLSTTGSSVRVESQDVLQSLRRWWNGETRERNLQTITEIVDSAFSQLELRRDTTTTRKSNTERVFNIRLKEELKNTQQGLQNLQTTYEADSVAHARISVLVDRIKTQLQEYECSHDSEESD